MRTKKLTVGQVEQKKTAEVLATTGMPAYNNNYMSIGGFVLTTKLATRYIGGVARQERNPQSPTAYSYVRWQQV
jgi:hypothetical protein